jgi:hypothetical protein
MAAQQQFTWSAVGSYLAIVGGRVVDEADDLRRQCDLGQLVQHCDDALRRSTMSHDQFGAHLQSMQPVSTGSAGAQQICIISAMSG